jgi:hypothetical protein
VTVDDNVAVCPLSIVTDDGSTEIAGAGSTITVDAEEVCASGDVALSVTT